MDLFQYHSTIQRLTAQPISQKLRLVFAAYKLDQHVRLAHHRINTALNADTEPDTDAIAAELAAVLTQLVEATECIGWNLATLATTSLAQAKQERGPVCVYSDRPGLVCEHAEENGWCTLMGDAPHPSHCGWLDSCAGKKPGSHRRSESLGVL